MRVPGRITAWASTAVVVSVAVAAVATSPSSAPTTSAYRGAGDTVVPHRAGRGSASELPPGVLPLPVILARYASARPGVTTKAKLVTLAQLATASNGELTQCRVRGCPPGSYVWLVLQQGPPGTFTHSEPPGLHHQPPGADSWSLSPVDATTGVARGDTEIGAAGQLRSSPWRQLKDLAPRPAAAAR